MGQSLGAMLARVRNRALQHDTKTKAPMRSLLKSTCRAKKNTTEKKQNNARNLDGAQA